MYLIHIHTTHTHIPNSWPHPKHTKPYYYPYCMHTKFCGTSFVEILQSSGPSRKQKGKNLQVRGMHEIYSTCVPQTFVHICITATPALEGLAGRGAAGQRQCRHETALCTCVGLQKRACRWVWPPGGPDESTCRESGEGERGGREGGREGRREGRRKGGRKGGERGRRREGGREGGRRDEGREGGGRDGGREGEKRQS